MLAGDHGLVLQTPGPRPPAWGGIVQRLRVQIQKPYIMMPGAVVVLMVAVAFGVQPKSHGAASSPDAASLSISVAGSPTPDPGSATPQPTATPTSPATPTPSATPAASVTAAAASPTAAPSPAGNAPASPTSQVAGVQATPTPDDSALAFQTTQCGPIKETSVPLAVEQNLSGISVRATNAALYPIDYFSCILMATGGPDATNLAVSLQRSQKAGSTHAVLIDLWIANTSKDFGQVNLRTASLAAAGQVFTPTATLGGRSEVVISSGQARSVTLVVAITNTISEAVGPVTLSIDPPLWGGKPTPGKYQLFLPTP
jgi:hypothetical protein